MEDYLAGYSNNIEDIAYDADRPKRLRRRDAFRETLAAPTMKQQEMNPDDNTVMQAEKAGQKTEDAYSKIQTGGGSSQSQGGMKMPSGMGDMLSSLFGGGGTAGGFDAGLGNMEAFDLAGNGVDYAVPETTSELGTMGGMGVGDFAGMGASDFVWPVAVGIGTRKLEDALFDTGDTSLLGTLLGEGPWSAITGNSSSGSGGILGGIGNIFSGLFDLFK